MESLAYFGIAIMFISLIALAAGVTLYLLQAFGLYKLAVNQRIENPWLAFIPYANYFIMGKIIKDLKILNYDIPSIEVILPLAAFILPILGKIEYIGVIFWLAFIVLLAFALYKLYYIYKGEDAKVMLILSIILPFMGPIYIFSLRNLAPRQQSENQAAF